MESWRYAVGGLILLLGTASCGQQDSVPEKVDVPDAQSVHVHLYLDDGLFVCGGQLEAYDRFIEAAFDVWTGEPPGEFRAGVHALTEPICWEGRSCAAQGEAWLYGQLSDYHELAHLIHQATDGLSAESVDEGLAEALGAFAPLAFDMSEVTPELMFKHRPEFSTLDNFHVAVVARFLMEHYGRDAYREYFRSLSRRPSPEEYHEAFTTAFGETIEEGWPAFISEPRCDFGLWYCDAVDTVNVIDIDGINCEDDDVLGFVDRRADPALGGIGGYWPYKIVHLRVPERRTYRVDGNDLSLHLGKCGECVANGTILPESGILDAGTYAFIVGQPPGKRARLSVHPID